MVKITLSFLSVILAMAFVCMAPANAMNTDTLQYSAVSFDDTVDLPHEFDYAVVMLPHEFDHAVVMLPDISINKIRQIDKNNKSVDIERAFNFSNVKGGGFRLAHTSKVALFI